MLHIFTDGSKDPTSGHTAEIPCPHSEKDNQLRISFYNRANSDFISHSLGGES